VSKIRIMCDSGAHSYFERNVRNKTGIYDRHLWNWEAFKEPAFHEFLMDYIEFLKTHKHLIDTAVTLDAIYDPEVSYGIYCYMKYGHGLDVIPVYHFAEDIKWFKLYMQHTDYIGISGLGQGISKRDYYAWVNQVFELICDKDTRLPKWKLHAFALTSVDIIKAFPFYSCDSSSWVQFSRFGKILVPQINNGIYDYTLKPLDMFVSNRGVKDVTEGNHIDHCSNQIKDYVLSYLDSINVKLGASEFKVVDTDYKVEENEKTIDRYEDGTRRVEVFLEKGVSNRHEYRDIVNFLYFSKLSDCVPEWPWPWVPKKQGVLV